MSKHFEPPGIYEKEPRRLQREADDYTKQLVHERK